MSGEELPDILTHVDPLDLAKALVSAWRKLLGSTPRRESILTLLAQSALETGWWKSCHCWNLGNAKAGDDRDHCFFRCNEVIGGKIVWFDPPHPQCRFRAFRSLEEGAIDYLTLMRNRFHSAWPAVEAGDPRAFVRALKASGYFTADLGPYENSVAAIFAQYAGGLQFEVSPFDAPFDEDTKARIQNLVAISLADLTRELGGRDTEPPPPDAA